MSQPPILQPPAPGVAVPDGYPLSGLTEAQRAQFAALQALVAASGNNAAAAEANAAEANAAEADADAEADAADAAAFATAECLLRYLRAAKFDAAAAAAALARTLQWRREFRPHAIRAADVEPEARNGKAFFSGFDRAARPVFVLNCAITLSTDPERYLRFILFNLERGTALCPHGVWQVCAIADVAGVGMFNQNPISVTTRLADIFQNHYPERLGWICIMNPSWYLWVLAKLILPFIDPVTKQKINFSTTTRPTNSNTAKKESSGSVVARVDESQTTAQGTGGFISDLSGLMSLDQLPVSLGGTYEYVYDHSVYWPAFTKAVGL
ncbi:CRAL-TRIO domain-containing protein [Obelidium mucronatum]|nr:CRAL-TRIO domain-containing protein [Obelidium mucronatum]